MAAAPSRSKIIVNRWERAGGPIERAQILRHDVHPEGLDVERWRFVEAGAAPLSEEAHVVSILRGGGALVRANAPHLSLTEGVHAYLPPGAAGEIEAESGTELIVMTAPRDEQARGRDLVVRDEQFIAACTTSEGPLRWVLTPQYLSRRVFLHHDATVTSKSGHPVSWFRTTMFDVDGLPPNADGEPVFKMSYDFRTEPNFCYDVSGEARVRMALHPYSTTDQQWGPWQPLDDQTTYHVDETDTGTPHRNKHEVYIRGGHVTLICMFDPAPTGAEQHQPGAYSSYGPLAAVLGTERHRRLLERFEEADAMIDTLSLAKAEGDLEQHVGGAFWARYEAGVAAQRALEARLWDALEDRRRAILGPYLTR